MSGNLVSGVLSVPASLLSSITQNQTAGAPTAAGAANGGSGSPVEGLLQSFGSIIGGGDGKGGLVNVDLAAPILIGNRITNSQQGGGIQKDGAASADAGPASSPGECAPACPAPWAGMNGPAPADYGAECAPCPDECAPSSGGESNGSPAMSQLFGSIHHGASTAGMEQLFGSIAANGGDSGRGAIVNATLAAPIVAGSTITNNQTRVV